MDKQQQVRINFLDEAEDCFDRIESVLLGLSATVADPQQLDLALRAAHSVKGGAGMMGFTPLSRIAHRLEDFFKILRVRYHSTQIDTEVETLLLQGVDSLRQVSDLHRQGTTIEETWLMNNINPIFDRLRQYLGDLQDEDENTLFAQSEDADPSLLMFEEGVETILDEFEQQLGKLSPTALAEALIMAVEKLLAFGRMANLEPFIQLCESIQQQAAIASGERLDSLTQQALTLWQRSHALVVRGSLEKLPARLEGFDASADGASSSEVLDLDWDGDELSSLNNAIALELLQDKEFANFDPVDEAELNAEELAPDFDLLAAVSLESEDLAELQSAFADEVPSVELESPVTPSPEPVVQTVPIAAPTPRQTPKQTGKTVRVPVEQLYQFNTLFGKLVLERNRVNLRLEQLKNFAVLMRQRMKQLEESNTQLRKWYDRASLEGIVPVTGQPIPAFSTNVNQLIANSLAPETRQGQFDALEMDRYSDLHLISQDQIETIVQLDEVTADIELGLQEMSQAIQELNQTTRSLQGNVTRTQMLPFADMVKPFPRLVRDLSLQFGKQVNLKIEGETTLIDRAIVETLNAPLMHLIRNAFDHGIEGPDTRMAAGKPPEGTITLHAVNRGTQTIITIGDDGGGIRLNKIRDRLRQMAIPDKQIEQMSEAEILDYIFQPGFSTSDRVTELSGRGVGMDVVRTNLQEIRGDIRVQTQEHRGTTFTLTVPFTLSILRVMVLERAGMVFAVPVNSVRELLRLQAEEGSSIQDLDRLTWQKQTIPLVRLEESLRFNRPCQPFEMSGNAVINKPTALVVGEGSSIGAIEIDRVWGEQEVTIRPIDSPLPLPMGFISSMVLGDGRVIPLIDPVQVLQGCLEGDRTQNHADLTPTDKDINRSVALEKVNTILVVDDSINVRRYLTLTLEKAGYQVEQAKDGQEAVDKLFGGLSVQAVICDIEMPRLDGYGVLEEIKAKAEFQSLPIAMLTSRSNEKHRKLAMNLGASAYFPKPYNEQELLQKMGELVGNPQ
jgi:chemosensory pili system protein ChpA (sensor histidine kinase/response regulator)